MKRSPLIIAVATAALMLGAAPSMASPDGHFQLLVSSRWCIQANGHDRLVDMDDCEEYIAPWQLWRAQGDDLSKMRLQSALDDTCLEEDSVGAVITDTCSDSTTQQWNVTTRDVDGKQQVRLQNVATNNCVRQGDGGCEFDSAWLTVNGARF
ncbi:hypothetical protein [Streptomyces sp. NPDC093109]|uniref:hypothetical protein n=1 Tax=Streptomyces sp. NPDC093109 TaxID=3154977 RepID=UPI00344D1F40